MSNRKIFIVEVNEIKKLYLCDTCGRLFNTLEECENHKHHITDVLKE